MRLLITWFDPNAAVSCQIRNESHTGGYKMAHMQISLLNNVSFIPLIYPLAKTWHLAQRFYFHSVHIVLRSSFLITTVCLLEISGAPLLTSWNMEAFMFSVTFMQNIEHSFNYQTYWHNLATIVAHCIPWHWFKMFFLLKRVPLMFFLFPWTLVWPLWPVRQVHEIM